MKYWIGVASKDHVTKGIDGGFCQLCHGKAYPLKRMNENDWIIYYSPKQTFGEKTPCQQFTAIGQVKKGEPYLVDMGNGFIPHRRDITFYKCQSVDIHPHLHHLSFIKDTSKWGYSFRFGHFEISKEDFEYLYNLMNPISE